MKILNRIVNRFESLESKRRFYDSTFQDIADLVVINHGNFNRSVTPGRSEVNKVFNNAGIEALNRLASAVYNGLTNPGSKWFATKLKGKATDTIELRRWTDLVTDHLLGIFNSSYSGFALHNYSIIKSWASFGTGCMYVEEDDKGKIKFCTIHLSELYIAENAYGNIDTVFRKFKYTLHQMVQRWGLESLDPAALSDYLTDPDREVEILHYVRPKSIGDFSSTKLDKFEIISTYIDFTHKKILSEKGYYKMPYIIPRFDIFTGDVYGRSPLWDCLNEVKMLNVMLKDIIKAGQLSAIPPLMTTGDTMLSDIQIAPGMILDGTLSFEGATIQPLEIKANLPFAMDLVNFAVERIRQSFFVDQLYFKEGTPITATEAIQRNEARFQALSPMVNRLQTDYLNNLIEVVFDIEFRAGRIEKIPAMDPKNKIDLEVEYLSPLANLQKMQDVQALQRAWAAIAPVSQIDPTIFDAFKFADIGSYVGMAAGVPGSLLRTQAEKDEVMAERQNQQQQQNTQQLLASYSNQLNKPLQ